MSLTLYSLLINLKHRSFYFFYENFCGGNQMLWGFSMQNIKNINNKYRNARKKNLDHQLYF